MYDTNQLLVFGILGTTVASFVVVFVAFAVWISSLKDDIHVHAPLLDNTKVNNAV